MRILLFSVAAEGFKEFSALLNPIIRQTVTNRLHSVYKVFIFVINNIILLITIKKFVVYRVIQMKKAISLLLAVAMLCCAFTVQAYADDTEAPTSESEEAETEPVQESKGKPAQYIFKSYSKDETEAIAAAIAADAEYWVGALENGEESYWIALRITEHPELANINILNSASQKMVNTAKAMFTEQQLDPSAISLTHFTGELMLHLLAILVMDTLVKSMWPDFDYYYEMFDLAEMNPEEERLPPVLINLTGTVIAGLF